jgi:hypothetical protein
MDVGGRIASRTGIESNATTRVASIVGALIDDNPTRAHDLICAFSIKQSDQMRQLSRSLVGQLTPLKAPIPVAGRGAGSIHPMLGIQFQNILHRDYSKIRDRTQCRLHQGPVQRN